AKGCLKVQRTAGCRFLCRLLPWQFSNEFHRYFVLKGQLLVLTNSSVQQPSMSAIGCHASWFGSNR
ncbi:hypothetical protein, partial [Photobacterium chitinilyticum]|uniref:hypothetical protein n=1 Tax=Photobacterium chitinilyticum TaxID=2485123 RepID=UPI001F1A9F06